VHLEVHCDDDDDVMMMMMMMVMRALKLISTIVMLAMMNLRKNKISVRNVCN